MTKRIVLATVLAVGCLAAKVPCSVAGTIQYTYDGLGRLVRAVYGNEALIGYTYDRAGNRLEKLVESGPFTYRVLNVSISPSDAGQVTGPGIVCPGTCSASYIAGVPVTLTAIADSGRTFSSWQGCSAVAANACTAEMDVDASLTATFISSPLNGVGLPVPILMLLLGE